MEITAAPGELESFNPATGERLGSVPLTSPDQVQAVVDEVAEVQPFWAQLPLADRAAYMRRAAQAIIDDLEGLATLLTREQGKPIDESYVMELVPTIDALHWIADNGPAILADERVPMRQPYLLQKRAWIRWEPLGVVAVIAPWNYPWSIPLGEVAIALMCGNGVVLKPAPLTPLIGQRIQAVLERAGVPEGLVRCIHGGGDVGQALVESSVAKVFFTGSVAVGRRVAAACAERLKGSVLELGGKDAQIVLADVDIENAVSGCAWGGFANAGQTCSGIERVYVMREVADRFLDGLVARAKALRVGDPLRPDVEIGPMASERQFELVRELVDDAVSSGAKRLCGGPVDVPGMSGRFFAPTVLTDVTHDMRIMREEVFGPVVPVMPVDSEEEAIALANDSRFGLGASVWTLDRGKGERIAARLEAGMVWINDHMFSHGAVQTSWGGVKESGLGRAHGKLGFRECVSPKQMTWDPSRTRNFWWHPYDDSLRRALRESATLLYGRDTQKLGALRRGAGPLARLAARTLRRPRP
ncbi:MAG: aldehyde dehydrogenase family protein [Thermoleophilaceae bacterium]|nr:aldehyde dehydrogenase family protein [Thermoleophilaceae bacterium]